MESQPTKLDKAVKISIIAGALIVALSIAYHLVVFLPKKEATRIELQKQEQETKRLEEVAKQEKLKEVVKKVRELDDQGKSDEGTKLIENSNLTLEEQEAVYKVFKSASGTWVDVEL